MSRRNCSDEVPYSSASGSFSRSGFGNALNSTTFPSAKIRAINTIGSRT